MNWGWGGKLLMQFPQKYGGLANGGLAIGIWRLVLEGLVLGAWFWKARQIWAWPFYETKCNSAKWLNPQHVLNTYSTNNELYYVIERNL